MTDEETEENEDAFVEPLTTLEELEAVIDLNPDDLVSEIERFTAEMSRRGRQLAVAARKAAMAAIQVKRVESRIKLQAKHHADVSGAKMTGPVLEATVQATDAWGDANNESIEAAYQRDLIKADVKALESKERMLDLLGRKLIVELRKDPSGAVSYNPL